MANNIIKRVWNQNRMVNIEDLSGMAFQAESGGHTFEISGVDDTGAAVELSGTVAGVFRRPDNADIALTGAASDGVASVTLTDDCYAVPGRFGLTVFVTSDDQKTAVYAAVGTVSATNGGAVAGDTPQDVVDLINAIEAAVATIPADYTDLMAAIAPMYSNSALYDVGSYAWYDGVLYRCTTTITTAETWTAAHWKQVTVSGDLIKAAKDVNYVSESIGNDTLKITGAKPLVFRNGRYIAVNTIGEGVLVKYDDTYNSFACAICDCVPGDVFTADVYGYSGVNRAFIFLDSNMRVVSGGNGVAYAAANTHLQGEITAPAGAAYVTFTNRITSMTDGYYAYKGISLVSLVSKSFKFIRALTESDDLNNIFDTGWYRWTSSHIPNNVPQSYGGYMLEYAASTTAGLQIVITTGGSKTIWFRVLTSSGWDADWVRLARYDQLMEAVDSIKGIISDFKSNAFNSVSFTQGTIGSTGSITTSDIRIRTGYIPIASLAEATCDNGGRLNFYCYNMSRVYLGRVTTALQTVTKSTILESYPNATYVRFVFGVTDDPDITPDDAATYNLHVYTNPTEFYQARTQPLTLQMVAEHMTDGVLTETLAYKWYLEDGDNQDYILTTRAKYTTTGDSVPYIRIYAYSAIEDTVMIYAGPSYEIAKSTEFVEQSWRMPNAYSIGSYQINLQIPTGCTLEIETLTVKHDMGIRRTDFGLRYHAHMGFDALFPSGSYDGIVSAAKLGFESCIVIPKITADGVPICFHDDSSISGQMTQVDGSAIPSEYDVAIQTLTYDQLMQWSIGYSKNPIYAGAKILKMDDFLYICAKTGMRPIFSVHPQHSEANWQVFKALLDKYGLTSRFSVKSGNYDETWKRVIDVFGDGNIYSIISLYSTSSTYNILNYINTGKSVAGITKTRIDVEFFMQTLEAGTELAQTQLAQLQAALGAGYVCSCVLEANTHSKVMKKYIDMGVTEFTNGRHCSLGLNW